MKPSRRLKRPNPSSKRVSVMAMFVHVTPESQAAKILRSGISKPRKSHGEFPGGVFAVPVTLNFFISHQWLRELKRRNRGPICGIYFRIPDEQRVWVGHYSQAHCWMTASRAIAIFMEADDAQGWEVIIPRRIDASEIHRVRSLPQVVGWRYKPGANGKPPFCTCKFCTRGDYGSARMRKRLGSPDDQ